MNDKPELKPWDGNTIFRTTTRSGLEAVVCAYDKDKIYCWAGLFRRGGTWEGAIWRKDGSYHAGCESPFDLLTVPIPPEPKRLSGECFVIKHNGQYSVSGAFTSLYGFTLVARIPLDQFEEGYGLTDAEKARLQ